LSEQPIFMITDTGQRPFIFMDEHYFAIVDLKILIDLVFINDSS